MYNTKRHEQRSDPKEEVRLIDSTDKVLYRRYQKFQEERSVREYIQRSAKRNNTMRYSYSQRVHNGSTRVLSGGACFTKPSEALVLLDIFSGNDARGSRWFTSLLIRNIVRVSHPHA